MTAPYTDADAPPADEPRAVPWDREAEESLIGAMLLSSDARRRALRGCDAQDLWSPEYRAVYVAVEALHNSGQPVDPVTVSSWIRDRTDTEVDRTRLLELQGQTPVSANAAAYAEQVAKYARLRQGMMLGEDLLAVGKARDFDAFDVLADDAQHRLAPRVVRTDSYDLTDLWDIAERERDNPTKPWVIPGCLRTNEVVCWTGAEGGGKSLLLRQIGVCTSCGVHPFTGLGVGIDAPQRVLFVDLQEDVFDMADELAKLRRIAEGRYMQGMYRAVSRPEGLDLLSPRGVRIMEGLLDEHHPSLVLMGPVVKMYRAPDGRSRYGEDVVDELTNVLGDLMKRYDFALMLEGHAGNNRSNDEDWRVRGSSVWRSWPAFSYGLKILSTDPREGEVIRARPDRYSERVWPRRLYGRPGALPWQVSTGDYEAILRAQGLHHLIAGGTQQVFSEDEVF